MEMPRIWKRKRQEEVNEEGIEHAIDAVLHGGMTYREAAAIYGIRYNTIFYRVQQKKNDPGKIMKFSSKYTVNQVFTSEQENMLEKYILNCSRMNYGLTYHQVRFLAYSYALKLGQCPQKWTMNNIAGLEWLKSFMKRHDKLSLRKPENTSLARCTGFNAKSVGMFFNNYEIVLGKYKFSADSIYNLDETGVTTVLQAPHVIAEKGIKQVGQTVSAERGKLITMCAIICANGNTVAPAFVFPRTRLSEETKVLLMENAPEGSLALNNSPTSGWMTAPLFVSVLEHLKNSVRCSKENPILLLLDNHESHCSLDAIIYARDNGIIMCTFPPHCTHRLQPLDVAVLGPFKTKLAQQQNNWLLNHPRKTLTVSHLPKLINGAYDLTFTRANILSAFRKTGVWPYNPDIFTADDFVPAMLATTANPTEASSKNEENVEIQRNVFTAAPQNRILTVENEESISIEDNIVIQSSVEPSQAKLVTPESVRPYPQQKERDETGIKKKGRAKGTSRILTSTPEKNKIEMLLQNKIKKTSKVKKTNKHNKKYNKKCMRNLYEVERSSEEEIDLETDLESDKCNELSDDEIVSNVKNEVKDFQRLQPNDYVLVRYVGRKTFVHFIASVDTNSPNSNTSKVTFLKKKSYGSKQFFLPDIPEKGEVSYRDIICQLPEPNTSGNTERAKRLLSFKFNFNKYFLG